MGMGWGHVTDSQGIGNRTASFAWGASWLDFIAKANSRFSDGAVFPQLVLTEINFVVPNDAIAPRLKNDLGLQILGLYCLISSLNKFV